MNTGPEQQILLYNSDGPAAGRCQHLLDLLIDLSWESSCHGGFPCSEWGANFDWTLPAIKSGLKQSDPFRTKLDDLLLEHVIPGARHGRKKASRPNRFIPATECSTESFYLNWHEYIDGDLTGDYQLEGRICFAQDVRRLTRQMHRKAEELLKQENYDDTGEVDERQTTALSMA